MPVIAIIPTILLIVGTTWLLLVLLMVRARLHPPRLTPLRALFALGRSHPDDIGYQYTPVDFDITYMGKPLTLRGALVLNATAGGRLVIVLHGFADSSAGACAWLPMLSCCGVNVLLLDLPGHGESGDAVCSAGFFEREAITQVITQIQQFRPEESKRISLLGISMGAAAALAAACQDRRVSTVIADCPFYEFPRACDRHARLFGLPGQFFQRPATWIIERLYHIRFDEVAPSNLLPKVPCPVLLIQAENDQFISRDDIAELRKLVEARHDGSREWTVPGAAHVLALAKAPAEYEQAVRSLLIEPK